MSEDALERHLEHGFKNLARAIQARVSAWEYSDYADPIKDVIAGDGSSSSTHAFMPQNEFQKHFVYTLASPTPSLTIW